MINGWNERTKDIRGFLVWTVSVAVATWAVFNFVFDVNRIASFQAKAEAYAAKADVLEGENLNLRAENQQLKSWLEGEPKSYPMLSKKITDLQKEINDLKDHCPGTGNTPASSINQDDLKSIYSNVVNFKKGEAVVDPKTKVVVGISDINSRGLAAGTITLPNGKTQRFDNVRPGQVWEYSKGNEKFQTILRQADWINNGVAVETRTAK